MLGYESNDWKPLKQMYTHVEPNHLRTYNFDDTEVPLELTRDPKQVCDEIETKKRL